MMAQMDAVDWSFFDVVPAADLPVAYSDEASFRSYGSVLSSAEVSCAASHLAMMQRLLDSDRSHVVILEDDVFLDPNCRLASIVEFAAIAGIEYLKLYARYFVPSRHLMTLGRFSLYRPSWPALGTQAYILSRAGAERLYAHLQATGLRHPIDASMDRYWDNGLPAVVFYPFPAMELLVPTTIHTPSNRHEVGRRNRDLTTRPELAKRPLLPLDSVRRRIADRSMMVFDRQLRQRIGQQTEALHELFYPGWNAASKGLAATA
jgi:glycosyl transferase family 25